MLLLLAALSVAQAGPRLDLGELDVPGRVPKPEVTVLIARQNVELDWRLELRRSFVPRVVRAVDRGPF